MMCSQPGPSGLWVGPGVTAQRTHLLQLAVRMERDTERDGALDEHSSCCD